MYNHISYECRQLRDGQETSTRAKQAGMRLSSRSERGQGDVLGEGESTVFSSSGFAVQESKQQQMR